MEQLSLDDSADSANKLKSELDSWTSPIEKITKSLDDMITQADSLNRAFVDGKTRLQEMDMAVANAAAGVLRLGGEIGNVSETIAGIAEGSRRSVIATEEQVSKIYASSKLLGIGAGDLVEKFGAVGYEVSQIGPNIETSIDYIRSVGMNANTVMKDVTNNMGQMNRYQFEGGVQGLAKMAAQASMLRFDMQQTFTLADKVLDPEGAIETAAAFQRLGVSVGNLADPFALMNQSINDPSGLQTSLSEVAKQFTYFDEETKSFKINPQGVLTLREMEKQTGVSAAEMGKMGLAAAELDKRLSDVSMAGLKFENEEDKQYLANIAKMGKGGKYEVELKDGVTKELQNLNQEEFDELIKQQRDAPKTVEDIQRSQLSDLDTIKADVKSIAAKGTFGVASSKYIEGNVRGAGRIATSITGAINSEVPESKKIAETLTAGIDKIRDLYISKDSGKIDNATFTKKLESIEKDIKDKATGLGSKGLETLKDMFEKSVKKVTGTSGIEKEYREMAKEIVDSIDGVNSKVETTKSNTGKIEPISYESVFKSNKPNSSEPTTSNSKSVNSQIDFGGTITIKVEAPAGVSQQQFTEYFETPAFKKMIYKYYEDTAKALEQK
jgi:hypothetical protein